MQRIQRVFDSAQGAERPTRLNQRLEQRYGVLELARVFEYGFLVRPIETHIDAVRRDMDAD